MPKNTNTTSIPKKPTKNVRDQEVAFLKSPWLQEYLDPASLRVTPINERIIDILAQELLDWSSKSENLTMNSFLVKKQIHWNTFLRWKEKFPKLKWAYDIAMMAFADRREVGGMTRKFDPGFTLNSMPMYDPNWKEFVKWKSSIKQQEENQQKVVIEISDLSAKIEDTSGRRSSDPESAV